METVHSLTPARQLWDSGPMQEQPPSRLLVSDQERGLYESLSGWHWYGWDKGIPDEGWKIHVSGDADTAKKIYWRVLHVLRKREVVHKFLPTLEEVNNQVGAQAGKILCVYPQDLTEAFRVVNWIDLALVRDSRATEPHEVNWIRARPRKPHLVEATGKPAAVGRVGEARSPQFMTLRPMVRSASMGKLTAPEPTGPTVCPIFYPTIQNDIKVGHTCCYTRYGGFNSDTVRNPNTAKLEAFEPAQGPHPPWVVNPWDGYPAMPPNVEPWPTHSKDARLAAGRKGLGEGKRR